MAGPGNIYLLGPEVSIAGLLLTEEGAVHRVVLLQLHGLHLLLDGIHGGGVWSSLTSATRKSEESLKTHVPACTRTHGNSRNANYVTARSSSSLKVTTVATAISNRENQLTAPWI
jgi:hypothetical protein